MSVFDKKPAEEQVPHVMPESAQQPDEKPTKTKSVFREFLSTVAILASAFLIALLLIAYVFQSYAVDGPSMEVTLNDKVQLLSINIRHSFFYGAKFLLHIKTGSLPLRFFHLTYRRRPG